MNALNAYNKLNTNVAGLKKSSEKLSSGYRINRAGDDAAGLAISEKMRSQIKGLNQAKRNAQDGISMIQTYEGAAQETHSILQRMKELAAQSANGTYDNTTDRDAIQLEFDQLNDELNQIADTDFNGTVVLNGGEMADGLRVTDTKNGIGTFDYKNLASQKAADAAAEPIDIYKASNPNTSNAMFNTVDDLGYTQDTAEQLWEDLGLDANKVNNIDVTFEVESVDESTGAVTYKVASAKASDGTVIAADKFDAPTGVNGDANTSGHGGFKFNAGGTDNVNVIFDATNLKAGDKLTLNLTGPAVGNVAPKNVGIEDGTVDYKTLTATTDASIAIGNLTDADMTPDVEKALKALDGAELKFNVAASGTKATAGSASIGGETIATSGSKITIGDAELYAKDNNDGTLTISTLADDGTSADKAIMTITTGEFDTADSAQTGLNFKIAIDEFSAADTTNKPQVTAKATTEIPDKVGVSKANSFENSTAIMTYAENITLQTGARTKDSVNFSFKYDQDETADMGDLQANLNLSARAEGLNTANLSLANQDDANYAIDQIDKAINKVSMVRASFGAIQNRLDHKITNLTTTSENLTEAEAGIRDTDMASEMMNYTKFNILQQAAQSMLAQANQQPQSILQLLG